MKVTLPHHHQTSEFWHMYLEEGFENGGWVCKEIDGGTV
jgi:hypothetical protein